MDISSGDITDMVFGRVSREDPGEFSLDGRSLSVLLELDGKKPLGLVAKKTGLSMGEMRGIISKLLDFRLIEPVEDAVRVLDKEFLDYLHEQLSLAVGPIAGVLIEDAAGELGYRIEKFPGHRAAELVDLLAKDIRREEKRSSFEQNLLRMIRDKGY